MDPAELDRIGEHIAKMQLDPSTPQDVEDLADYAAKIHAELATLTARLQAAEAEAEGLRRQRIHDAAYRSEITADRDALRQRCEAAEGALYSVCNALSFWLDWAEARGAVTLGSRDLLRLARPATPTEAGG